MAVGISERVNDAVAEITPSFTRSLCSVKQQRIGILGTDESSLSSLTAVLHNGNDTSIKAKHCIAVYLATRVHSHARGSVRLYLSTVVL